MDIEDYQTFLKFFPPVMPVEEPLEHRSFLLRPTGHIVNDMENPYIEANSAYKIYNAVSPLKELNKDILYSVQIINDLKTLRILLNSNITSDRFMYELNS